MASSEGEDGKAEPVGGRAPVSGELGRARATLFVALRKGYDVADGVERLELA